MVEDNRQERGKFTGVGYMRRTELVIGYGGSDLHARIASDWSEGGGVEYVDQMAKRHGRGQGTGR